MTAAEEQAAAEIDEGHALHEAGNVGGALGKYLWAIQLEPWNATAWYNVGVAREDQGDKPRAIEAYRKALVFDPSNEDARYNHDRLSAKPWRPPAKQQEVPVPDWRTPEYLARLAHVFPCGCRPWFTAPSCAVHHPETAAGEAAAAEENRRAMDSLQAMSTRCEPRTHDEVCARIDARVLREKYGDGPIFPPEWDALRPRCSCCDWPADGREAA